MWLFSQKHDLAEQISQAELWFGWILLPTVSLQISYPQSISVSFICDRLVCKAHGRMCFPPILSLSVSAETCFGKPTLANKFYLRETLRMLSNFSREQCRLLNI